jgi:uncharacterized protein YjdB
MSKRPKKIVIIPIILVLIIAAVLLVIPIYAATTLSIIQVKENTSTPLKPFIYIGEEIDLDVLLNGNPLGGAGDRFTWKSSNTGVATVSDLGIVTAKSKGSVKITVSYKSGSTTASASHTLQIKQKVTRVQMSDSSLSMYVGDMDMVEGTPLPANANDIANWVTYASSNTSVASVDKYGNIKGLRVGIAIVSATFINKGVITGLRGGSKDEAVKDECIVTVKEVLPSAISLDLTQYSCYTSQKKQLHATVLPNNATNKAVTWSSSDTNIATVSQTGLVTAVSEGTATITAKTVSGAKQASCIFDIEYFAFDEILLDAESAVIYVGKTERITASYTPSDIEWKIGDSSVATIADTDMSDNAEYPSGWCEIVAHKKGETILTATAIYDGNEITKTCIIKVRNISPTNLTFPESQKTMYVGDSESLTATVTPSDATVGGIVYESSDESIAKIDKNGRITAVKTNVDSGEIISDCIISATIEGEDDEENSVSYFALCELKVLNVQPTSIGLTPSVLNIEVGDKPVSMSAEVKPGNVTVKDVLYVSDNEAIASVDENGIVTPVASGKTKIRVFSAADEDIYAECTVSVIPPYSENIVLKEDCIKIGIGHMDLIQILAAPGKITFESNDTDIAEVDGNGWVTGISRGSAEVILSSYDEDKDRTVTATCLINVIRYVEQINFDKEEYVLNTPEGNFQINAEVLPEDADEKALEWTSSNEKVAIVGKDGVVTPVGYGSAAITAKATDGSEVTQEMPVYVAVPATGIELLTPLSEKILHIDGATRESFRLEALVLPEAATLKTVKWKASSDAVSISAEGESNRFCVITARKASEDVTITASDERETKSVTFRIIVRIKVTSVQAELVPQAGYAEGNPINVINSKENIFKLQAKTFPADASNTAVKWESLSPNVLIDTAGNVVIAKDAPIGIYDVRVTSLDGGKIAVKRIKVNQGVKNVYLYPINDDSSDSEPHIVISGRSIYLAAEVFPFNAYSKMLDVSVAFPRDEDGGILELVEISYKPNENRIRVIGLWESFWCDDAPAVITAKSTDGSGVSASYSIWVEEEED